MNALTKYSIKEKLREVGISSGDLVILHSGYFCIGPVEGGLDSIIGAFLETITKTGTLVMPTFTLNSPFDIKMSRSECGFITEKFRLMDGVIRSNHPTHSVAAIGPLANEITKNHNQTSGTGKNSPFHKMAEHGGKICLIGTENEFHATIIHTAQIISNAPYTKLKVKKGVYDTDGNISIIELKENPVACNDIDLNFKKFILKKNLIKEIKFGNAILTAFDANEFLKATVNALKDNPLIFNCDNPKCKSCAYIGWKCGDESFIRFYWLILKDKLSKFRKKKH